MIIRLSELDTMRFGIPIATASLDAQDEILSVIKWCESKQVKMLIARCPTDEVHLIQNMEKMGFYLTDTLVYYQCQSIINNINPALDEYSWRLASAEDAESVERLAAKTFHGYFGHYHADSRLNKIDADLVYSSWASNSCKGGVFSDVVFLICQGKKIVAFLSMKKNDSETCEIILNGVDPLYQGKGLYTFLISLAKKWALEKKNKQILVSTQVTNIAVQKVWCRHGFEPLKSFYTLHKWFSK